MNLVKTQETRGPVLYLLYPGEQREGRREKMIVKSVKSEERERKVKRGERRGQGRRETRTREQREESREKRKERREKRFSNPAGQSGKATGQSGQLASLAATGARPRLAWCQTPDAAVSGYVEKPRGVVVLRREHPKTPRIIQKTRAT